MTPLYEQVYNSLSYLLNSDAQLMNFSSSNGHSYQTKTKTDLCLNLPVGLKLSKHPFLFVGL